jgi:hypothetical protein
MIPNEVRFGFKMLKYERKLRWECWLIVLRSSFQAEYEGSIPFTSSQQFQAIAAPLPSPFGLEC